MEEGGDNVEVNKVDQKSIDNIFKAINPNYLTKEQVLAQQQREEEKVTEPVVTVLETFEPKVKYVAPPKEASQDDLNRDAVNELISSLAKKAMDPKLTIQNRELVANKLKTLLPVKN